MDSLVSFLSIQLINGRIPNCGLTWAPLAGNELAHSIARLQLEDQIRPNWSSNPPHQIAKTIRDDRLGITPSGSFPTACSRFRIAAPVRFSSPRYVTLCSRSPFSVPSLCRRTPPQLCDLRSANRCSDGACFLAGNRALPNSDEVVVTFYLSSFLCIVLGGGVKGERELGVVF
ncbi:hypothetical protein PIB30_091556 [Stylosanthes scabra]|uniref:RNase H type-1 domain-containing protein n=1 Tax=Stylosanthes scabra TaxID=79078 RepID=A0ABU6RUU1_9FABA|nr:hypothetical protein [Stylosanthes scabra]